MENLDLKSIAANLGVYAELDEARWLLEGTTKQHSAIIMNNVPTLVILSSFA